MFSTKKIAGLAILTALSILLVSLIHFPIFPAAAFLEYDPADIPIFLATFMYGAPTGLLLTAIVCILQGVTVSAHSGFVGILMHFMATGSYVLVAGMIYSKNKTLKSALFAMIGGVVAWLVAMTFFNLIFTPLFMGTPRDAVLKMLLPVILPFNLIKVGVNSILTFLLYKKTSALLLKTLDIASKKKLHLKKNKPENTDDSELPCTTIIEKTVEISDKNETDFDNTIENTDKSETTFDVNKLND